MNTSHNWQDYFQDNDNKPHTSASEKFTGSNDSLTAPSDTATNAHNEK